MPPFRRLPIILLVLCSVFFVQIAFGQGACSDPGAILTGSSITLDPNSDGYFSSYSSSGYTLSRNEFTEFEVLTGAGGADLSWTPLPGNDPNNDLSSGGGCGNTDIVTDTDGGSDYAYYSVVDPDGTADNGDEYLAFALRISNKINGAFGFSFLMDSDNNCGGSDGNAVCGNPCFEYEVQLSTSNAGGDVELYNVDGCYGTSDCNTAAGGDATICAPCNSEGIQVCADSTACGNGGVFWVFYINFSQIPSANSTSSFSLTPASNTSGNQIIYKSANVSDYGGLDDINDIGAGSCGCTVTCSGSSCSKCEQDCAFSCAAEVNSVNPPLPLRWLDLKLEEFRGKVKLKWQVAEEYNNESFIIERRSPSGNFAEIGSVLSRGNSSGIRQYEYLDDNPDVGPLFYRIKQVDIDGSFSYSLVRQIQGIPITPRIVYQRDQSNYLISNLPQGQITIRLYNLLGQVEWEREVINQSEILLESLRKNSISILEISSLGKQLYLDKHIF
ncbi:MAG: hypothetical protein R8P61_18375 [Bacteroidia bacterium]|nr:hypothetical protein [Bacteroidia bacterium]